jgi:hypothetical protein
VSTFISAGNRADVSGNDSMQYWEQDQRTDVVGMCLKSIGNPRKFLRIARRLGRRTLCPTYPHLVVDRTATTPASARIHDRARTDDTTAAGEGSAGRR